MSGPPSARLPFPYQQDAIKISAQFSEAEDGQQTRRFSVDPCLTDFSILRNLIGRAFDMKGDFALSYRVLDDYGGETFLPMVSDWDLSAAFLSASDPDLQLMVDKKNIPMNGNYDEEPWDVVKSSEIIAACPPPIANHHRVTSAVQQNQPYQQNGTAKISLNPKLNTVGLFNTMERWVQKAKTFVEDISVVTSRPPLSDAEFRNYMDPAGVLQRPTELRFACYYGGIEPSLRRVVWKHLLNVYPDGLSGNGRMEYIRSKSKEYYELRDAWKTAIQNGLVSEDIICVSNMVRKDVVRTDRHLKYFAGHDENPNIASLFNILTTYAINHPSVSYCQGMSDLASPLLVCMGDEAQAYICFCALMLRVSPNFSSDGIAMSLKFAHLSDALAYYDSFFWAYLKSIGADDLLFCYRWLLLELKREFAFEDSLRMMEVLWSSLPYNPQDVPLFEVKYTGTTMHSVPIAVPSLTSSYSKVCAIRRSSTCITNELRHRRLSRKQKAAPHLSLDENSVSSLSSISTSAPSSIDSRRKPFHSMDETMEVLSTDDFLSTSPFEIISLSNINSPKPKLVKNLKEFYQIAKPTSPNDSTPTTSPQLSRQDLSVGKDKEALSQALSTIEKDISSVFLEEAEEQQLSSQVKELKSPTSNNNVAESNSSSNSSESTLVSSRNTVQEFGIGDHDHEKDKSLLVNEHVHKIPAKSRNVSVGEMEPVAEFVESENDSGHCCSGSLEGSLDDPEFHTGSTTTDSNAQSAIKIPPPIEFGGGNPFLMFLALTLLLQHREHIMRNRMDYNETAMYFDKMVRKHNVTRVLSHARQMHDNYLKQVLVHRV